MLASHFDPLGILAPFLLKGKLILQKVILSGIGWDDDLPGDVKNYWKNWIRSMEAVANYSTPRYCFSGEVEITNGDKVIYQLHGFCDASNHAFSCVVYLRRLVNEKSNVAFIQGKSKLVSANQRNWVISRKELEAARLCADLMLSVSRSLKYLDCRCHFWTDSQVTLKRIVNPGLHLPRFVKRRVDKILLVAPADAWNYVHSSVNPADVGTREASAKHPNCYALWLDGPKFLLDGSLELEPSILTTVEHKTTVSHEPYSKRNTGLDRLIASSPDLYTLKKRVGYLIAFKHYLMTKNKGIAFSKPTLDATFLDMALMNIVKYVQSNLFGDVVDLLKSDTPDAFESFLKNPNPDCLGDTLILRSHSPNPNHQSTTNRKHVNPEHFRHAENA